MDEPRKLESRIDSQEPGGVVRAVVGLIQGRKLKVGDKLPPIRELASELSVKPTVVRDALLHAQSMGLVRIVPRSGAFVRSLTYAPLVDALANTFSSALMQEDHNLFHLLDARRALEMELVGRAAKRRHLEDLLPMKNALLEMRDSSDTGEYVENDIRFHGEIARLAGNPVLTTMHRALMDLLRPSVFRGLPDADGLADVERSHTVIYTALVDGDAEAAKAETWAHLSVVYDSLLRGIQGAPLSEPELLALKS